MNFILGIWNCSLCSLGMEFLLLLGQGSGNKVVLKTLSPI